MSYSLGVEIMVELGRESTSNNRLKNRTNDSSHLKVILITYHKQSKEITSQYLGILLVSSNNPSHFLMIYVMILLHDVCANGGLPLPYVTLACRLLANESRMSSDPMELCSFISE